MQEDGLATVVELRKEVHLQGGLASMRDVKPPWVGRHSNANVVSGLARKRLCVRTSGATNRRLNHQPWETEPLRLMESRRGW
jgi:hypothetical protein